MLNEWRKQLFFPCVHVMIAYYIKWRNQPWQNSEMWNPESLTGRNIFLSIDFSMVFLALMNNSSSVMGSVEIFSSRNNLSTILPFLAFLEKYSMKRLIRLVSEPSSGTHTLLIFRSSIFLYTFRGISGISLSLASTRRISSLLGS